MANIVGEWKRRMRDPERGVVDVGNGAVETKWPEAACRADDGEHGVDDGTNNTDGSWRGKPLFLGILRFGGNLKA
ncbi:hypothetical protein GOP47_0030700 [Adiantum capillus-veneris]|nr:hypothetical protein GOP47_0030700 [Adiantum capillus-veneris]